MAQSLTHKIKLIIGGLEFQAQLNDSKTARAVWKKLPLTERGQFWGEEIYFSIPVKEPPENPQEVVDKGTLAYWPPGNAMCIFWGPTPMSHGKECRPASPVNVIGEITSDLSLLKTLTNANVTVEKVE